MDGFLYVATLAVYGLVVLGLTARLTDRWLLAALAVAVLAPSFVLAVLLPEGSLVRSLTIPMSIGPAFAGLIRGRRGWGIPLRRPRAE